MEGFYRQEGEGKLFAKEKGLFEEGSLSLRGKIRESYNADDLIFCREDGEGSCDRQSYW